MRIKLNTELGNLYVMLDTKQSFSRSSKMSLRGILQEGFGNYAAFMYRPVLVSYANPATPDYAVTIRDSFSANVSRQFDDEASSNLALSYLTGQKTLLDEGQKEKLRLAGLAHVVVASGYHLSVIINLAKKRLGKISRFATLAGAAILMFSYISITGFSPSMMRAGILTILSLWAWYFGRRFHPVRLLLYAAAISLLLDPSTITNLAWQLSFAAYGGIIFLSPLLARFFYGDKNPGYFASLIIASISAQLFCLPLSIFAFGKLSGLAILSNVLITPSIPILMLLTFLTGTTNLPFLSLLAKFIASMHLKIIDYIANIPWCTLDIRAGDARIFLLYVPILVALLVLRRITKYSFRPSYALEESPDYGKIYAC